VLASTPDTKRQKHSAYEPFASFLLSWYFDQLAAGKIAKACTAIVQLFAGFTLQEVRAFAEATCVEELQKPIGPSRMGSRPIFRGARFLKESVELLHLLQDHGFDILTISGSNKWSVEPVFARLSVPPDHVIGIDLHLDDDVLSPNPQKPIPIQTGKVDALHKADTRSPVLVASDSRNDIPLLLASTDVKVYVNSHQRNTDDFFKLGNVERNHSWIVLEEPAMMPN
jgi:phosphoserine phosphatase